MKNENTIWEDRDGSRSIDLQVRHDGQSIHEIIPIRVTVRRDNGSMQSIGVHTSGGRRHLMSQIDTQSISEQLFSTPTALV